MKINATKAILMPFKEKQYDEEGNLVLDKKTGEPVIKVVKRVVRHNPRYIVK
jgi:hypothetical protein